MNMQEIYIDDTGDGFPLVLVHGFLGSSEMWNLQKQYFNKHFRVIAPALPGFGESYKVKSLNSINEMAKTILNSLEKKKQLTKLISSNPNDRLLAIQIASKWVNKNAIPFLRRGLKDSDSRVVIASAAGISYYKGRTIDLSKKSQASRPPRNVSLMR